MCGRFINLNKIEKLKKIFDINILNNLENNISYNISPSQLSIIITNSNFLNIENAKWGFEFNNKNNTKINIINSRLETIKEKIFFKESFEKRKCIIPTNGYYEWTQINKIKKPFFIHLNHLDSFYFAGIWKYLDIKKNNSKVFSIITKPSNKYLQEIHYRMPLIFSFEEAQNYLEIENSDYLFNYYHSIAEEELNFFEVSKYVNNPINNSSECIRSINYI